MKKIVIPVLLLMFCVTLVGCSNNDKTNDINEPKKINDINELKKINDKIIEYFSSNNAEYDNLGFHYIDETNNVIVVGLKDNSKEQQEKFKKEVIDSNLITFVQGEDFNHN